MNYFSVLLLSLFTIKKFSGKWLANRLHDDKILIKQTFELIHPPLNLLPEKKEAAMYVINFALEMENVGKEYFEKLAKESSLTGIRNIFSMLAAEQQELIETFKSLQSKVGSPLLVDSEALERARDIFAQIFSAATSGVLKNDLDAYRHALKIETEIVKFFEEMAQVETNEDAKTLLMEIVEEEKKLFSTIESIHDFVAAPQTLLAWMEFSNRKEM